MPTACNATKKNSPTDSNNQDFIISDINEEESVLRARFQQWGYLYFKRLIETAECQQMLQTLLNQLAPYIGLDEQQQPILHGQPFFETDPIWDEVYPKIQSLEAFHSFFHQPHVTDLMQKVCGEEVFVYPMKMARISTPGKIGYETPPHQDAHSHNAGPTMAGIWLALHDVPQQLGRVKVLPKSHKKGVRPVFQAQGVGGIQCEIYDDESTWHVSDFEQGDVLIFHSCCVHKAEPNLTENQVRLTIDTRFCDYGAPVFFTNLDPHHGWRIEALNWEYIYKSWGDTALQYYWRDYPNLF
ncbi:phytanoyl-CoA dioxygenase family protein [Oceanicoccus sp. KOV_DT_Chl]|uniref:phytanoyl-CoA dioxygenase family protein n=1 Tax=Oceanicoccus sp. KOV_DT_Chl TaxID=1904639 RepID=UPI000C7DF3F8|nr:phytanoyl-CoA dioxygenase family protein [Oceanicoccus sp. KOV_DT_Chl]